MARFPSPHSRTLLPACIFISAALHILRRLSRVINRSCAKPLQRKCSMRQPYLFGTRVRAVFVFVLAPNTAEPEKWLSLLFELHSIDLNNVVNYTAGEQALALALVLARAANGKHVSRRLQIVADARVRIRIRPSSVCQSFALCEWVSAWINELSMWGKKVKGRSHERRLS